MSRSPTCFHQAKRLEWSYDQEDKTGRHERNGTCRWKAPDGYPLRATKTRNRPQGKPCSMATVAPGPLWQLRSRTSLARRPPPTVRRPMGGARWRSSNRLRSRCSGSLPGGTACRCQNPLRRARATPFQGSLWRLVIDSPAGVSATLCLSACPGHSCSCRSNSRAGVAIAAREPRHRRQCLHLPQGARRGTRLLQASLATAGSDYVTLNSIRLEEVSIPVIRNDRTWPT